MKTILFLVVTLCCSSLTYSQVPFGTTFGYDGYDAAYRTTPTSDGGFFVGGRTNKTGSQDYWVVKFDRFGKVAWDSSYGTSDYELLWSIQGTTDNGALLGGFSGIQNSGTESALMYKIDSVGRVTKEINVDYPRADHAHWFAQRKNGGYYWAGHTDSEGDPRGDIVLEKQSDTFDSLWQKTFDKGSGEHAHTGTLTMDDGVVLLGHTSIGGYEKFWAIRVDSNGTLKWSKTFSSSSTMHDSPYEVKATREGGFAFIGGSGNNQGTASTIWLVVVDSNGQKIIDKHYGSGYTFGWSGIQASDGGFVLTGFTDYKTAGGVDVCVVKTTADGTKQWLKTYGSSTNDIGYDVIQHRDQFVIAGTTYSTGDGAGDLWTFTIDSLGNVAAYDTSSTPVPNFHFAFDSSAVRYEPGTALTLRGTIQNLTSDTLEYNFSPNRTNLANWTGQLQFGTQSFSLASDSSATSLILLPQSKVVIVSSLLPPANASGEYKLSLTVRGRSHAGMSGAYQQQTSTISLLQAPTGAVTDNALASNIEIYPNPSRIGEPIMIRLPKGLKISAAIEIFDLRGVRVRSLTSTDGLTARWDGRDGTGMLAAEGQYIVRIKTEQGYQHIKLILQ